MTLAKELSSAKFDETVEVAIRLGVDTRKADQNIRGSISLPNGTGKTVRVAVFAEGAKAAEAEAAGADIVGSDDLIEEVQKGNINFDAVIATPNLGGSSSRRISASWPHACSQAGYRDHGCREDGQGAQGRSRRVPRRSLRHLPRRRR